MAQYTAIFTKPYEDGYENLPSQNTPITAETLNDKDDAIVNIETYLSGNDIPTDAEGLSYDNTDSGLTADNVQSAIDEIVTGIPTMAEDIGYDNTDSGLTADNVQGAVDELADEKVDKTGVDVKTDTTGQFNTITGGLMQSCVVDLEPIQSGSGTPSPSNVRAISGHTQVDIWNDPKYGEPITWNQLVRNGNFASTSNWTTSSGDTFTVSNNVATFKAGARYRALSQNLSTNPAGHKIFFTATAKSYTSDTNKTLIIVRLFTSISPATYTDVNISLSTTETNYQKVMSIPSNIVRVAVLFQDNATSNWGNITIKNVNFVDLTQAFGETVADYIYNLEQATTGAGVAYFRNLFPKDYYDYNSGEFTCVSAVNGDPYIQTTINLGGTYYGGTLDAVSGKFTVTHALYSNTWGNGSSATDLGSVTRKTYDFSSVGTGKNDENSIMNCAPYNNSWSGNYLHYAINASTHQTLYLFLPNGTSNDFVFQLCFELATPFTIQLDPQTLETLVGQNDVFAPLEGQSLESLSYREVLAWDDVDKAINVKLDLSSVAPIEYTDKASQSYNQKQLFIKDNKLCQALASISSGASFTENTNFEYTTLAEIIEPLIP